MRRLALACTLALPCAAHAADDFIARCEREMKPVFEVRAREAKFDLSTSLSSRVLNTKVSYGAAAQLTMGMTSGTHRTEIGIDGPSMLDAAHRRECVAPRIYVDLAYEPLRVFVAREFHQQSCAYRTVYEHEMRHVQVYRDNLPVLERHVREALEQRYAGRPLYGAPGTGLARLESDVDNWLRPFIKAELAAVERQQLALDSPEETFRLSHACLGEVEAAMGSSF
ncbi:hypothetical protein NX774_09935 [Massilia agilis]|uniref:DUF922 domain-containing protein n=1 Tax=Massilia agilis TaxID=1811226 RepID=A0ABT2DAC4_9BURK|nr:hypothetical protein [Massilia agilis]MCS0808237.1 hypothetical protein [Massilia agilis]